MNKWLELRTDIRDITRDLSDEGFVISFSKDARELQSNYMRVVKFIVAVNKMEFKEDEVVEPGEGEEVEVNDQNFDIDIGDDFMNINPGQVSSGGKMVSVDFLWKDVEDRLYQMLGFINEQTNDLFKCSVKVWQKNKYRGEYSFDDFNSRVINKTRPISISKVKFIFT